MEAYTISDRGTWRSFGNKGDLAVLVEGDPRLLNRYDVILLNPARKCLDRLKIGIGHAVISRPWHDLKYRSRGTERANGIRRLFLAVNVFSCPQYLDEFGFGQPWIGLIVCLRRQVACHKGSETLSTSQIVRRIKVRH
jgi:hypothetical protein